MPLATTCSYGVTPSTAGTCEDSYDGFQVSVVSSLPTPKRPNFKQDYATGNNELEGRLT